MLSCLSVNDKHKYKLFLHKGFRGFLTRLLVKIIGVNLRIVLHISNYFLPKVMKNKQYIYLFFQNVMI